MKSKDLIQQELREDLVQAFKSTDENAIAQAFSKFAEGVQQSVLDDFNAYQQSTDATILAKRGMHQLTSEETKFYQGMIDAMKSDDIRQAFTGLNNAYPETVIENVLEDIKTKHPLLAEINFMNTTILTKMLVNKKGVQLAQWGVLGSKITKELEGAIGKIDLTICKLTAFMPISKDMLEVGPEWIDAYVRATLSEAIALALETSIITGSGNNEPIGMDREVSEEVTVTGGVYPKKTKVKVISLKPVAYGEILGELAKGPNGKTRNVDKVLLVVNPIDYFSKIFPATTVRGADGKYVTNVFPFPTTVIQSAAVTVGEAVFGIAEKYFMGIGAGSNGGKIEYSDEVRFLDDERVYMTKMYGNGRAMDDNAFILADISDMVAEDLEISVKAEVKADVEADAGE